MESVIELVESEEEDEAIALGIFLEQCPQMPVAEIAPSVVNNVS